MPPVPAETARREATSPSTSAEGPSVPWLERLQAGLDRLLVADVFLVLAGALWFGLGVGLHLRGSEAALQAFQRLWPLLFQPAIGLLMAAALLSGGLGWWRRRGLR
ncbi:MAG: hypothetical protein RLZZ609_3062 [Cyanobacteriota bacterium]|jgi:hypothetical protein